MKHNFAVKYKFPVSFLDRIYAHSGSKYFTNGLSFENPVMI